MLGLLAGLHALLFRAMVWLLKQPLKALWALALSVLALLGEEVRRWLGVLIAGLMILGMSWATLKMAAEWDYALLLVMLMGLLWLYAVAKAAHLTAENRVWKVRQRQAFKELKGEVRGGLEGLRGDLGRRAWGTPAEGMWKGNRQRRLREQAEAEVAAAEAEQEHADAVAWEETIAAKRAERERFAAAALARRRGEP